MIESVTLEPELEEALASATDAELCDIAGNCVCNSYWFLNPFNFQQISDRIAYLHLNEWVYRRGLLMNVALFFLIFSL